MCTRRAHADSVAVWLCGCVAVCVGCGLWAVGCGLYVWLDGWMLDGDGDVGMAVAGGEERSTGVGTHAAVCRVETGTSWCAHGCDPIRLISQPLPHAACMP